MKVGDRLSWTVKAGESLATSFFLLPPRSTIHLLSSEKPPAPFLASMAFEREGARSAEPAVGANVFPGQFNWNQIVMGIQDGDLYRLKTEWCAQSDLTIELWLYEQGPDELTLAVDRLLEVRGLPEISEALENLRSIRLKQSTKRGRR